MTNEEETKTTNFIRQIIDYDLESGKHQQIHTRFPPEPNGFLHIGHAKSICLNFGIAADYKGLCNLRFDDTNPAKEESKYADSIMRDVKWLGFDWQERLFHSSDYFEKLYQFAVQLIKDGKAFVCELNAEQMREYRGTLKEPGKNSPFRDRSVEENLALFEKMKAGEFEDGTAVLRAKIDMGSPNINLRDPVMYRVKKVTHHRSGDEWCIYPMYDFTHCISDALEGITHSLCTLEFEAQRPLYDWYLDQLDIGCHPQQIEFARFELDYTITSKRKLNELVVGNYVSGWDDPRMPTIAGLRRRGVRAGAIRELMDRVGVTKKNSTIQHSMLDAVIREDLDLISPRVMSVIDPLKVSISNLPDNHLDTFTVKNHPKDESMGTSEIPFTQTLYIEREDFMENPPGKYRRLKPGGIVKLRYAYVIRCDEIIRDEAGEIIELICSCFPETLGQSKFEGKRIKGIIHWVSAAHALDAEVRVYDRLFNDPSPGAGGTDYKQNLNPDSLKILPHAKLSPLLKGANPDDRYQFERLGYFCLDEESSAEKPVYNRVITLRDNWQTKGA
ncbi:MAG: glutamine--tRNA ligase/YqeY domain fusion protein [bacterium]